MTNDELSDQISLLEAEIKHLARLAEGCLKIILISKIGIMATVFGLIRFDQLVFVGSITAILGGIVAAGSNTATLGQFRGDMRAAEQLRNKLIDELEFPS